MAWMNCGRFLPTLMSPTHMDRRSMALPAPSGNQPPGWVRRKLAMRSGVFTQGCCRDGFERPTARTTPLRHCVNGCWIWLRRPESTGVRRGCSIRHAEEARSLPRWRDAWSRPWGGARRQRCCRIYRTVWPGLNLIPSRHGCRRSSLTRPWSNCATGWTFDRSRSYRYATVWCDTNRRTGSIW